MQRIEELMQVVEVEEPDEKVSDMDRVICPWIQSVANCPIPLCQSCQLSCDKQQKPKVVKPKEVPEEVGPYCESNTRQATLCCWISMLSKLQDIFRLV